MRIGSVFSGIGGLELGLERAGVGRVVWQCECDPYALAVLAKHWPDAIRFTDVRALDETTPKVDLICGGFPCQDISNAGRRDGLRGERSGLFFDLMRVVRLLRPRFVVLENVAALLGRGLGDVLGELSASGFDAEWDCVPASSVGAPHRRDRVFIVADAERHGQFWSSGNGGGMVVAQSTAEEAESQAWRTPEAASVCCYLADPDPRRLARRDFDDARWSESRWPQCERRWEPEPDVGRVAHGVPSRVDRLRCLGNAVVPQVAEVVGRRVIEIAESLK